MQDIRCTCCGIYSEHVRAIGYNELFGCVNLCYDCYYDFKYRVVKPEFMRACEEVKKKAIIKVKRINAAIMRVYGNLEHKFDCFVRYEGKAERILFTTYNSLTIDSTKKVVNELIKYIAVFKLDKLSENKTTYKLCKYILSDMPHGYYLREFVKRRPNLIFNYFRAIDESEANQGYAVENVDEDIDISVALTNEFGIPIEDGYNPAEGYNEEVPHNEDEIYL